MSKANIALLASCCFIFPILFYSASHLNTDCPCKSIQWSTENVSGHNDDYSIWSKRRSSHRGLSQLALTADNAGAKPWTQALKDTSMKPKQMALESALKLQYALDSTDIHLEDAHIFSVGRYINTFTSYLEAIVSDSSIDQQPFHELRQRYFSWWLPSSDLAYLPWEPRPTAKTGIVLTVGKGNFVLAAHCIQTLRTVMNSTLPIEVFYAGDEDLPEDKRQDLKAPMLNTVNVISQFNETIAGLRNSGYAMKPFAALASSFQRVILIDADTIFMRRPDNYFEDHEGLKETGLHYFRDRALNGKKTTDWIKTLMQDSPPSATLNSTAFWQEELEHQQESGVVFINKAMPSAFMSLLFTAYLNTLKVRGDVYSNVFGDKETFWLASELSSAPYTFAPHYASIIGTIHGAADEKMEMCSSQPLHLDHLERPFWFNSGLRLEKVIDSREYIEPTHYMLGTNTTLKEQFSWRFRSHHTFCVSAEEEKWVKLGEGEKDMLQRLVEAAKKVDVRFLGHEGGIHNDGTEVKLE